MYIHAFWCGVAAVLILETVGLMAAAARMKKKIRSTSPVGMRNKT